MAGNREKDWGKEKVFREGQASQVLDTLFFDFIDLAKELQPKVVVAENVKGLLMGAAKEYVIKIYEAFDKAGYYCQHFLLDASKMGVPQRRERVFFICLRKDLASDFMVQKDMFTELPDIEMVFNEKEIPFKDFDSGLLGKKIMPSVLEWYDRVEPGESVGNCIRRLGNKEKLFSYSKIDENKVLRTILSNYDSGQFRSDFPTYLNVLDIKKAGSYPLDYDFGKLKPQYLIGMSVPPVMTANVATEIYNQWLCKINK